MKVFFCMASRSSEEKEISWRRRKMGGDESQGNTWLMWTLPVHWITAGAVISKPIPPPLNGNHTTNHTPKPSSQDRNYVLLEIFAFRELFDFRRSHLKYIPPLTYFQTFSLREGGHSRRSTPLWIPIKQKMVQQNCDATVFVWCRTLLHMSDRFGIGR